MKLIHTSPEEIKKITKSGHLFNDCLFFSEEWYCMTAGNCDVYTYTIEIDEDEIIQERDLYDEEIVKHISKVLDVDLEIAERLLDGRDQVTDYTLQDEEAGWFIQTMQGECGKVMGFGTVESTDEQGVVYIIPMFGRENELKLEGIYRKGENNMEENKKMLMNPSTGSTAPEKEWKEDSHRDGWDFEAAGLIEVELTPQGWAEID